MRLSIIAPMQEIKSSAEAIIWLTPIEIDSLTPVTSFIK